MTDIEIDAGTCCDHGAPVVPAPIANRPGLPELRRRIGTHGSFRAALLDRLASSIEPALTELSSIEGDTSAAFLDAWSVVADILTFYTERIADEHYVRTAVERRSMVELARLIGRSLRPGLAAEADLVFTMDTAPGAPPRLMLIAGTPVQSQSPAGGPPACFETATTVELRAAWNTLRPRRTQPQTLPPAAASASPTTLVLAGTATAVRIGDGVLYRTSAGAAFGLVVSVNPIEAVAPLPTDPGRPGRTEVVVETMASGARLGAPNESLLAPSRQAGALGASASWVASPISASDLETEAEHRGVDLDSIAAAAAAATGSPEYVCVFRVQAGLFGAQSPASESHLKSMQNELIAIKSAPPTVKSFIDGIAFNFFEEATAASTPGGSTGTIHLDAGYPTIPSGALVVLRTSTKWAGYGVNTVAAESFAAFEISGRSTRLDLDSALNLNYFPVRATTVYAQPERLPLADPPDPSPVPVSAIELDGLALGLQAGRAVAIEGPRADDPGTTIAHVTNLADVTHDLAARTTTIKLSAALPAPFARTATVIRGNVVRATHGQTRHEVLGNGDATTVFPRFALRQPPLTYTSANDPSGMSSTLQIWVDDVRWWEVPDLNSSGPSDRVYVVREDGDVTVVTFGDGVTGARLPTGNANVRAVYRCGSGLAGRVGAGELSMLLSRPAGLSAVTNPRTATGGAAPETVETARESLPVLVRTLGRVVSLRDYEDFARAFAGIAKAHVVWARTGSSRGVLVTVAGSEGSAVEPGSSVYTNLLAALRDAGDPLVNVRLVSFDPRRFRVRLDLAVAADRDPVVVRAALTTALRDAYRFDARGLGDPVAQSEILALAQAVPGVVGANVVALWCFAAGSSSTPPPGPPPTRLEAVLPSPGADLTTAPAAQLLVLDAEPIEIGVMP